MKLTRLMAVVCACALAATASAQTAPAPKQFVHVLTVHATPQGALEYEAFVKKVGEAAKKIKDPQRVMAYQVTAGGAGYTYMFLSYYDKWGDTDEQLSPQQILFRALGDKEGAKVLRAGRMNIASTESAVYRLLPDLSTKPKAYDPPPAYIQVYRNHVKPGMSKEWERVIAKYRAASEKVPEAPTAMRRVSVEGPGMVYVTSSPYARAAERDAWPTLLDVLKKAYGDQEGLSLDQKRLDSVERSEAFILKHRPDLGR